MIKQKGKLSFFLVKITHSISLASSMSSVSGLVPNRNTSKVMPINCFITLTLAALGMVSFSFLVQEVSQF